MKPKEAHRYWEIMPSADAAKKVVAFASQYTHLSTEDLRAMQRVPDVTQ